MTKSTITIDVELDDKKIPDAIYWNASDSTAENRQKAKAMLISFWDGADKAAMRIDLWNKDMMVDEMVDFFYQTMQGMAETLGRSTGQDQLAGAIKGFSIDFLKQFQDSQRNLPKEG